MFCQCLSNLEFYFTHVRANTAMKPISGSYQGKRGPNESTVLHEIRRTVGEALKLEAPYSSLLFARVCAGFISIVCGLNHWLLSIINIPAVCVNARLCGWFTAACATVNGVRANHVPSVTTSSQGHGPGLFQTTRPTVDVARTSEMYQGVPDMG